MDTESAIKFVNGLYFLLFFGSLSVSFLTLLVRIYRYKSQNLPIPILLPRDLILMTGFLFSFGAIIIARNLDATNLINNLLWVIVTGGGATVAMITWALFELFVIERRD